MEAAAKQIVESGVGKVVVKGGHLAGDQAIDVLYDGWRFQRLAGPRIGSGEIHGTGCTFSSAITAILARGSSFFEAVQQAKSYITGAIAHGLKIGEGHGLAHHFWRNPGV